MAGIYQETLIGIREPIALYLKPEPIVANPTNPSIKSVSQT